MPHTFKISEEWKESAQGNFMNNVPLVEAIVGHARRIDEAVVDAMPAILQKVYQSDMAFRIPVLSFFCRWILRIRIEHWPNEVRIYRGKRYITSV